MTELHKEVQAAGEGVYAVPTGAHVKDDEEVTSHFAAWLPLVPYTWSFHV